MDILRNVLWVAFGGAAGSVMRYLVGRWIVATFPLATFTVNIVGSLLIGLLVGLTSREALSAGMRLLLVTGFCGGFTTFSTFANESYGMLESGHILTTALYISASVFAGILAVYVGFQLSR